MHDRMGSPADDAETFNASQVLFTSVTDDGGGQHYEIYFDTYESGWKRFVLDTDVAKELLAFADHYNKEQ